MAVNLSRRSSAQDGQCGTQKPESAGTHQSQPVAALLSCRLCSKTEYWSPWRSVCTTCPTRSPEPRSGGQVGRLRWAGTVETGWGKRESQGVPPQCQRKGRGCLHLCLVFPLLVSSNSFQMFVALSHSQVAQRTYICLALRFHYCFQLQCTLSEAAWETRSQARGRKKGWKRDEERLANPNSEGHESSKQDLTWPSLCLSTGLLEGQGQNLKISVYPEGSAEKLKLFI